MVCSMMNVEKRLKVVTMTEDDFVNVCADAGCSIVDEAISAEVSDRVLALVLSLTAKFSSRITSAIFDDESVTDTNEENWEE